MKAIGDYTKQVYNLIQVHTEVAVDGPYGHFDFGNGNAQQLWIAGGMGITPFLAYLHTQPDKKLTYIILFTGKTMSSTKIFRGLCTSKRPFYCHIY